MPDNNTNAFESSPHAVLGSCVGSYKDSLVHNENAVSSDTCRQNELVARTNWSSLPSLGSHSFISNHTFAFPSVLGPGVGLPDVLGNNTDAIETSPHAVLGSCFGLSKDSLVHNETDVSGVGEHSVPGPGDGLPGVFLTSSDAAPNRVNVGAPLPNIPGAGVGLPAGFSQVIDRFAGNDSKKLLFMSDAVLNSCMKQTELHPQVLEAFQWMSERTEDQRIAAREEVTLWIEEMASECASSGMKERWFVGADPQVKAVSADVAGPVLEFLADHTNYHDVLCVDMFRSGGPFLGKLPFAGNGRPESFPQHTDVDKLRSSGKEKNLELISSLKEDEQFSEALWELTQADAVMGRMTAPVLAETVDLDNIVVAPRFPVEKGQKPDGSSKVRPVDDETRAGVNGSTQPCERLQVDGIDVFIQAITLFVSLFSVIPLLSKADIDAAFRRVPIQPAHRWASYIAFKRRSKVWISQHLSMPFGAIAAVHAWDRLGSLLRHLGRVLLHLPLFRYVDDYFSLESPRCAEHAMRCFSRMVNALLGASAVSPHKFACGLPLDILGVTVQVNLQEVKCWPSEDKVVKWTRRIKDALDTKCLVPGLAGKLAGALSWAAQSMFNRLGRAMLLPLYRQQHKCRWQAKWSDELRLCLEWWSEVLRLELVQAKPIKHDDSHLVHLFADARGSPPRLAAVLLIDGRVLYSDWEPPSCLLACFETREDNQILGLELLAIAFGLSCFAELISHRRVFVWSDNTGSEGTTRKGVGKAWDHSCIVHSIWLLAAKLQIELQIERVPTDENIADLPSRQEYALLEALEAEFVAPILDSSFWSPSAWESLSVRKVLGNTR